MEGNKGGQSFLADNYSTLPDRICHPEVQYFLIGSTDMVFISAADLMRHILEDIYEKQETI